MGVREGPSPWKLCPINTGERDWRVCFLWGVKLLNSPFQGVSNVLHFAKNLIMNIHCFVGLKRQDG